MPGSPDPAFGSSALLLALAGAIATLVAGAPLALRRSGGRPAPARVAAFGGAGYAALCVGLWAVARAAADAFDLPPAEAAPFLLAAAAALAAQAGVPYYLAARYRLRTPLVGLSVATLAVVYAFLHVRGETDPIGLYVLFGPLVVAGCLLLGLVEAVGRRLLGRSPPSHGRGRV